MRHTFIALVVLCVLAAPFQACAEALTSDPSVLISEVSWAGSSRSDADEWLELVNLSDAPIDLSNWKIDGGAGSAALTIPSGTIPAHGTFIVANYGSGNIKSVLNVEPQFVTSSVSLSNSALHLILRDETGGAMDEVTGNSFGTTGAIRASQERTGLDADAWRTATASSGLLVTGTDFGTPGTSAVELASSDTPTVPEEPIPPAPDLLTLEIITPPAEPETPPITELLVPFVEVAPPEPTVMAPTNLNPPINPPGYATHDIIITEFSSRGNEWVEYRNETENPITLDGFTLEDASGRSLKLTGILIAHSYGIARPSSGTLNNDGDLLRLRDPTGFVLDEVSYGNGDGKSPAPSEGTVAARTRVTAESWSDFKLTTTPTPGEVNLITEVVKKTAAVRTSVEALVASPDAFPPPAPRVPVEVAVKLAVAPKVTPTKITLSGPTYLYAKQPGLFVATATGTGSSDARITWLLDDEVIGTGGEIQLETGSGTHVIHAEIGRDGTVLASAERTLRVKELEGASNSGGASASATKPGTTKKPTAVSGSTGGNKTSGSSLGFSLGATGVVIATEKLMGVRKFLLDDGTTVYLTKGNLPPLVLGDSVRVYGRRVRDGKTLNTYADSSITILGHDTKPVTVAFADSDVPDELINHLVVATGTVKYPKGKKFTLSGETDLAVNWKVGESLPASVSSIGAEIEITGILTKTSDVYTLLPRGAEDIQIIKPAPPKPPTQSFDTKSLAGLGTNVAIALATLFATLGFRHLVVAYSNKRKQKEMEYEIENIEP
ncbi:MAG: lamin tail domain-containing protein [bacterium]